MTESEALDLLRPEALAVEPAKKVAPAVPEPVDLPRWLARLAALFSQFFRRA